MRRKGILNHVGQARVGVEGTMPTYKRQPSNNETVKMVAASPRLHIVPRSKNLLHPTI